jgi:polysaccharide biosynthesis/export protein
MSSRWSIGGSVAALISVFAIGLTAQAPSGSAARPAGQVPTGAATQQPAPPPSTAQAVAPPSVAPPGYVIGPDDVLTLVFWKDKDLSGDVIVRPDGMISVALINEVQAAGLTPEQLRVKIVEMSSRYLEDPNVVVVVKQINSRKVFITGMVNKIGIFQITSPTTVLQLITMAGGLQEYAKEEHISILRTEKGRQVSYRFNYKDVLNGRKLEQNIQLLPGDTVVVP